MSGTPTFAAPPTFLGVAPGADAAFVVAGVPFDIGTTNRSGARFGPSAIRHASRMLIDGAHPSHWTSPVDLPLADVGDFAIALGDIAASLKLIEDQASAYTHLVTLGGDHG
ncbi:MAG: arginase family protein, partial [Methylocystis sp.]